MKTSILADRAGIYTTVVRTLPLLAIMSCAPVGVSPRDAASDGSHEIADAAASALTTMGSPATGVQPSDRDAAANALEQLPLEFERNEGQYDARVRYLARSAAGTVFITDTGFTYAVSVPSHEPPPPPSNIPGIRPVERRDTRFVEVSFAGGHTPSSIEAEEREPGETNYYRGQDPSKWHEHIQSFRRLRLRDVYAGVDVVFYGSGRRMEYDFVVAPGADSSQIELQVHGADRVEASDSGGLSLHAGERSIELVAPQSYQTIDGVRHPIESRYEQHGAADRVNFALGAYDHQAPLVIDPLVTMATFVGGSAAVEYIEDVAVDSSGNIYLLGQTSSTDFPTTAGAFQTTGGGTNQDLYVMKLNRTMTSRIYSTYLGGSGYETDYDTLAGGSIVADSSGNAYLVANSSSANFPTTAGAFQTSLIARSGAAVVVKINSTGGTLGYSTYLGGTVATSLYGTYGNAIAIDSLGSAFVTGWVDAAMGARDATFPVTAGAAQTVAGGWRDMFVARLRPDGSGLIYATYLGGSNIEYAGGIVVDSTGRAIVTGQTNSTNFPTAGTGDTTYNGGISDAILTILNPTGSAFVYSGYFGGSGAEMRLTPDGSSPQYNYAKNLIALDSMDRIYLAGLTTSADFPTLNAADSTYAGSTSDVFLARFNPDASLSYSTYIARNTMDGYRMEVSVSTLPTGEALVGWVNGTATAQYESSYNSGNCGLGVDALARFDANGGLLDVTIHEFISYFAFASIYDSDGTVLMVGAPGTLAFSTPGVVQPTYGGGGAAGTDGWLARLDLDKISTTRCHACTGDYSTTTSYPCPMATPYCTTSAGTCSATLPACTGDFGSGTSNACPSNSAPACYTSGTFAGTCKQCSSTNTTACFAPTTACDTATAACSRCTANFGATTGAPCASPALPVCLTPGATTGTCVQCANNSDCTVAGTVCNTATHACVPPVVVLTSPPAGPLVFVTTDTTPTITGTGTPGQTVTVTSGAITLCTAVVSAAGTWTCTPTTPLALGLHPVTATSGGVMSTGTLSIVQCTMNSDCSGATPVCNTANYTCVAAAVALTSPAAGTTATTTDTTPTLTGTGVPGQMVTVTSGATTLCTAVVSAAGTWTCTPATALPYGTYPITATSNGATSMATEIIVQCTTNTDCSGATPVCNTANHTCVAAAVTLTSPPAGGSANTTSTTPAITGTGIPGQMVTVTSGGVTLCTATVSAAGTWTCTSSALTVGLHTIVATSGGATSMGTLVVQCTSSTQCSGATPVCNTATRACVMAAVALTNPPAGGSANTTNTTPAITGTGVPGAMVTVTEGTVTVCTATVSAAGTWSCTPTTALSIGSHMLSARSGGAMSSGTLVVQCTMNSQCSGATPVCNTTLGACVGTSLTLVNPPANGTAMTMDPTPDITGTGSAGFTVTVTEGGTTLCTTTVAGDGTWTCTSAMLAPGSHTITATSGTATSTGTLVVLCTMNAQCAGATPVCNTSTGACVAGGVTLTSPPQDGSANTTSTMPTISGTGTPGQMVTVTDGGTTLCTATVDAAGMWSCVSSDLPVGVHVITATSGAATANGTIVVQCTTDAQCSGAMPVCNTASGACVAAQIALTNPMAGGTSHTTETTPMITGTGVPGAMVTVTEGGTTLCTATVASDGTWSCALSTALPVGDHTITATSDGATSMGTLVEDCTMDAQCSGNTPVCDLPGGVCVQCENDSQCAGSTPRCQISTHTCVPQCVTNTDCPAGSHCDTTTSMCAPDVDAGVDAATDVVTDVVTDVAVDARGDVMTDARMDVASNDVTTDVARDAARDVATDRGPEAGDDAAMLADAGVDASPRSLTGNGACGCRAAGSTGTSRSRGVGLLGALSAMALVQGRRRRRTSVSATR